jgi:hypothetical protein
MTNRPRLFSLPVFGMVIATQPCVVVMQRGGMESRSKCHVQQTGTHRSDL